MISRADALKALRELQNKSPDFGNRTPKELFGPDEIYGKATQDRAVALVSASVVDEVLKAAIITRLVPLSPEMNGISFLARVLTLRSLPFQHVSKSGTHSVYMIDSSATIWT